MQLAIPSWLVQLAQRYANWRLKIKDITCNTINYRSGFIEVIPNIHPNCINLETWGTNPEFDISSLGSEDDPDDAYQGNVELELSLENAQELIRQLQIAINSLQPGQK